MKVSPCGRSLWCTPTRPSSQRRSTLLSGSVNLRPRLRSRAGIMRESERLKKLEERFGTGRAPIDPETSQIACDRGTATLDDYAIVYPKQIQQAKGILTLFVPKAADWLRSGGSGLSPTWV